MSRNNWKMRHSSKNIHASVKQGLREISQQGSSYYGLKPGLTQGQEVPPADETQTDQQRSLHQDEQGYPERVENCR